MTIPQLEELAKSNVEFNHFNSGEMRVIIPTPDNPKGVVMICPNDDKLLDFSIGDSYGRRYFTQEVHLFPNQMLSVRLGRRSGLLKKVTEERGIYRIYQFRTATLDPSFSRINCPNMVEHIIPSSVYLKMQEEYNPKP